MVDIGATRHLFVPAAASIAAGCACDCIQPHACAKVPAAVALHVLLTHGLDGGLPVKFIRQSCNTPATPVLNRVLIPRGSSSNDASSPRDVQEALMHAQGQVQNLKRTRLLQRSIANCNIPRSSSQQQKGNVACDRITFLVYSVPQLLCLAALLGQLCRDLHLNLAACPPSTLQNGLASHVGLRH